MPSTTQLHMLRTNSKVDCDTLDIEVARALGPFHDATSNQAIAFLELAKPTNENVIIQGLKLAEKLHVKHKDAVPFEQFAAEVMTVLLASRITPHLTGRVHVQVNPYSSYSTAKIIANAQRIIEIFNVVDADFPSSRVCIKIPSTFEGIQACRILEKDGICTLATTLFSMEQASLAADAGCSYIAPYVNELPVHFVPGHVDPDKGFALTRSAQRYYARISSKTQVMPASLTSVAEVLQLAGADHITISTPLLAELAATSSLPTKTPVTLWFDSDIHDEAATKDYTSVLTDESAYRIAFTLSKAGANEKKLVDAINIFCGFQDELERLVKTHR